MSKVNYEFAAPISILKEGEVFVAYSPSLDLSTVGDTMEQARERFDEALQIFFEEITARGTADDVLFELGWQKEKSEFVPPLIVSNRTENFSISAAC